MVAERFEIPLERKRRIEDLVTQPTKRTTAGFVCNEDYFLRARRSRSWTFMGLARRGGQVLAYFLASLVVHPVRRWHKRNLAYKTLMSLDDRMLKDIGITHNDIPSIVKAARSASLWHAGQDAGAAEISNDSSNDSTDRSEQDIDLDSRAVA